MRPLLPILCLAALSSVAKADDSYETAVRLVSHLYLERQELSAVEMVRSCGEGLVDQVPWLLAQDIPGGVLLVRGDGPEVGRFTAESLSELPEIMEAMTTAVAGAGHTSADLKEGVLNGFGNGLDRYSYAMSGGRLIRFNARLKGTMVGIGANLKRQRDHLEFVALSPGAPAEKGGVEVGDFLIRIDGRSTMNMPMSEVFRHIRGDTGTTLELEVSRGGAKQSITLRRAVVVVPTVTHRMLVDQVGYVKIDHMSQKTAENLDHSIQELLEQGALRGLVVDLRGNTGGSMKESARLVDRFVQKGLLLRTQGADGGAVANLQAEMKATQSAGDLQFPVVLVVDGRTASGAEILAGALIELDRAAMIGAATYGKGLVQKVYTLDPKTRFKMTVARYILANERQITKEGLIPDVTVGKIVLASEGVRYEGWDEFRQRVPWQEIVPNVVEHSSWRGTPLSKDLEVEIARKAILATVGPDRASMVQAVKKVAAQEKERSIEQLVDALAAQEIDWSDAEELSKRPLSVIATVRTEPSGEGKVTVIGKVKNLGTKPIHRVLLHLQTWGLSSWDELVIPLGSVNPQASNEASVQVEIPFGIRSREDVVRVSVQAANHEKLRVEEVHLIAPATIEPTVSAVVSLQLSAVAPQFGGISQDVVFEVTNNGEQTIVGFEAHLGYPESEDIELLMAGVRLPTLKAGETAAIRLPIELLGEQSTPLPLSIEFRGDEIGRVARWDFELSGDKSLQLVAPKIDGQFPLSAPVGPLLVPIEVMDDHRVEHAFVYLNGHKVAWHAGTGPDLRFEPMLTLREGTNRVSVYAKDDLGLTYRQSWSVLGIVDSMSDTNNDKSPE